MPASSHLIQRSVALKRALIDHVMLPRFDRFSRQALERQFGPSPMMDESELTNFLDRLVLQERLPDGSTVVEHFVAVHPELPEEERAMLLGWRDVVEGIFEVKRRDGDALLIINLIDELTYRVHSNVGPGALRQMPRGSFVGTRLVPLGNEWLLSGVASIMPAAARQEIYRAASELAGTHPELIFRNPDKLARGWELQRAERGHFIDFFGSDLVVLTGRELPGQMRAYTTYRTHEALDDAGRTAADRFRENYGTEPPHIDEDFPAEFLKAASIALIYDDVEGLNFVMNFGQLEEIFINPALAGERKHRQALLKEFRDANTSPLAIRRLAERDPGRASEIFQRILKKPGFSWTRDGEALLRRYKAPFFEEPTLPGVIPLSESQTRSRLTPPEPPLPSRSYRKSRGGKTWRRR